jgi:hypothetical protein
MVEMGFIPAAFSTIYSGCHDSIQQREALASLDFLPLKQTGKIKRVGQVQPISNENGLLRFQVSHIEQIRMEKECRDRTHRDIVFA